MKRNTIVALLMGLLLMPAAHADSSYAGVMYGQVGVDFDESSFEVETGNIGLTLGATDDESGLGFEVFYALTLNEDDISINGNNAGTAETTAFGFYALYKTPGKYYVKAKGGFAYVDLDFDLDGAATSLDDDTSGFSYGGSVGMDLGRDGAIELSYLVLPEFEDVSGTDVDADVEMISLHYFWTF